MTDKEFKQLVFDMREAEQWYNKANNSSSPRLRFEASDRLFKLLKLQKQVDDYLKEHFNIDTTQKNLF